MLNIIWAGFFIAAFIFAVAQSLWSGQADIWPLLVGTVFSSAKAAFEICLSLTGMLCLWLGLLKIAEAAGLTEILARLLRPLFKKIMPDVPENSPALGSIVMNIAANMLGLDNAATPMGLRAMEQLQELNPRKDYPTPAQELFLVINTSAVTIIPITILMYHAELGASNPAAVFIPILLATSASTLVGFFSLAIVRRLDVFNRVVLSWILGFILIIGAAAWYFISLPVQTRMATATGWGNFIIFTLIILFITAGLLKKVNVYDAFIDGAKEGFTIAVKIIPYLVAMLVGIAVFRASGGLDFIVAGLAKFFAALGVDTEFVAALPTALMKPLSGSGARAMMIETMQTYGADSFQGFVASVVQGSTETTFYVLAVYFGAVGITKSGAALPCALLADLAGIVAAICLSYIFY